MIEIRSSRRMSVEREGGGWHGEEDGDRRGVVSGGTDIACRAAGRLEAVARLLFEAALKGLRSTFKTEHEEGRRKRMVSAVDGQSRLTVDDISGDPAPGPRVGDQYATPQTTERRLLTG